MALFASYYAGIGCAVLVLGYLQVSICFPMSSRIENNTIIRIAKIPVRQMIDQETFIIITLKISI